MVVPLLFPFIVLNIQWYRAVRDGTYGNDWNAAKDKKKIGNYYITNFVQKNMNRIVVVQ